jgi:hypothetical protein
MKSKQILVVTGLALVCLGSWIILHPHTPAGDVKPVEEVQTASAPVVESGTLSQTYTNAKHRFSFKYPDGYTVREVATEGADTILIENDSTHQGIQIYMTAYTDADTTITADRVRREVPEMEVSNPQPLNIGAGTGVGLAFEGNNQAFGGASREVWFIFGGTLYQISTYPEYDALLRAIFGTWTFG